MSLQRKVLSFTYYPLRFLRLLSNAASFGRKRGRLRVLLFHDVPSDQQVLFRKQLEWLARSWKFVGADQFADMLAGRTEVSEDSLLLTFDDGFYSNRIVAEEVLNPMNIPALFFVVSSFTEMTNRADQVKFIQERLFPGSEGDSPMQVPEHMRNMTPSDLQYLIQTGHTIGAHTATHARLSTINSEEQLVNEISTSADRLEELLGVKINHFAFPFGNIISFSAAALRVASERFPYVYTGMRGDNAGNTPSWALRRDAITPTDSLGLMGAFLEGAADRLYRRHLKTYESWSSR